MEALSGTLCDQSKFWQLFQRQYGDNYPGIDDSKDTQWRIQTAVERARRTLEDAYRAGVGRVNLVEVNIYSTGSTYRSPDEPEAKWLSAQFYTQYQKQEERDGKIRTVTYKSQLLDKGAWWRVRRTMQQCLDHLGLSYRQTSVWGRYRTYEMDTKYIAPWIMPPLEKKHWAKLPALQVRLRSGSIGCCC